MNEHLHSGFVDFLVIGVMALVFFNLVQLAAAHLAMNESTSGVGKALGALVTF